MGRIRRRLSAVLAPLLLLGCAGKWRPAEGAERQQGSMLRGDDTCGANAADCNPCAVDVRKQLNDDAWQHGDSDWTFALEQRYPSLSPREAYQGGLSNHVQGFVRLNGAGTRYAMLHSGGLTDAGTRAAALSVVEPVNGRFELTGLLALKAAAAHTGGLFTLGQYAGTISRDGFLMLVSASSGLAQAPVELQLPVAGPRARGISTKSGGVAMARLAGGGYLLLANQGGDGASSGHSHFFRINADLRDVARREPEALPFEDLGSYQFRPAECGPRDYHHSENLALITECGTRDLYAVHVGSSNASTHEDSLGLTFWRVSQVVFDAQGPRLALVGAYTRGSDFWRCFGRGGGSAFVEASGRIELLCHQRAYDRGALTVWDFWRHLTDGEIERGALSAQP